MAQDQIGLELRAPQIEVAVLEAQLFGRELFALCARDLNRRCLGRSHDLERRRVDLDIAGRQLGIAALRRARDDLAFDGDDRFALERVGLRDELGWCPGRPDADLDDAVPIAQIDEDDSSEVAAPVDPAPQAYPLPGVLLAELAAAVGAE